MDPDLLARVEDFSRRVVRLATALKPRTTPARIIEQVAAAGGSVGANAFEADEAMSRKDFAKTIGIVIKELNECRFWIRLISHEKWIAPDRLTDLEKDALSLKRILGANVHRTRANSTLASKRSRDAFS